MMKVLRPRIKMVKNSLVGPPSIELFEVLEITF